MVAKTKGIQKSVTPERVVEVLNEALALDPDAVNMFVGLRARCNKALAEHPSIQVGQLDANVFTLGPVGLIDGLFGIAKDGCGCVAADYELRCRKGHTDLPKGIKFGEPCPKCQNKIVLGRIIGFRVIRKPGD